MIPGNPTSTGQSTQVGPVGPMGSVNPVTSLLNDTGAPSSTDLTMSRKVLESIAVLLLFVVIFTTVGGINHDWGVAVALLLVGIGLQRLGKLSTAQTQTLSTTPVIP